MLVRVVRECEVLPRGYGIAWFNFDSMTAVALPVGLHWIAGFTRRWWQEFRLGYRGISPTEFDKKTRKVAYVAGWQDAITHKEREDREWFDRINAKLRRIDPTWRV